MTTTCIIQQQIEDLGEDHRTAIREAAERGASDEEIARLIADFRAKQKALFDQFFAAYHAAHPRS